MNYSPLVLDNFFNPKNVGYYDHSEENIGRSKLGRYENGAVIELQIKVAGDKIVGAKFRAYGNCLIIAACSYLTTWLENKTLQEARALTSAFLIEQLTITDTKIHCALLVEDALREAIHNYSLNATFCP